MSPRTRHKNTPRAGGQLMTPTEASKDNWLVHGLVFGIRIFLVLFVAFARAVVLVAGENIPGDLFDQHNTIAAPVTPTSSDQRSHDSAGSLEVPQTRAPASLQGFYVIFVGREVGYTTSNTLMTSLVQGIPNNSSRKFNTFEEAVCAYSESVLHGNVRRVRTVIQPSGHVEFLYEYIGMAAGFRNLDEPHLPAQPLATDEAPPISSPPTPRNLDACADLTDVTTGSSVSSATSASEPNGLVIPVSWSMVNSQEAGADTVIISAATSSIPPVGQPSVPGALTVIFLDGDEDSSTSSVFVNNSVSTHSAHSSDIYYADKTYDLAFAAYIEEEETKESNMANAGPSGSTISVD